MRNLLLINPNTSTSLTKQLTEAAARCLPESFAIDALTATSGFPVIANRASYEVGAEAVVEAYSRSRGAYDAVVIGCFGDPGLESLRDIAKAPVFALAESSIREADTFHEPFAILTMGKAWIEILNERVALAGARAPFAGVFACEGTGLDVSRRQEAVFVELARLADAAVAAGARTLILGGGAFAGRKRHLNTRARVIDCMEATIQIIARTCSSRP